MRFVCFKQKTAYEMRISDWSSDVCSSDLIVRTGRSLSRVIFDKIGKGRDMISTNSSGESALNMAPDARTALISGYDLISELLEDFRCEKTTYEVMEYGAAVEMACNAYHELVGIFVLEGAAEIAQIGRASRRGRGVQ